MEALRSQITQSETDVAKDFPHAARDAAFKALAAKKAEVATWDTEGGKVKQTLTTEQAAASQYLTTVTNCQNTLNAAKTDAAAKKIAWQTAAGLSASAKTTASTASAARGAAEGQLAAKIAQHANAVKNCRDTLAAQLAAYTAEYNAAKAQQEALAKDVTAKDQAKRDAAAKVAALEQQIKDLTAKLATAEAEVKTTEASHRQSVADLEAAKAKLVEAQNWTLRANTELHQFHKQFNVTANAVPVAAPVVTPGTPVTPTATTATAK